MGFSKNIQENIESMNQALDVTSNFDVVYRTLSIGGRTACAYFIDGFTKDEVLLKVFQVWSSIKPEDMPQDAHGFSKQYIPYGEVGLIKDTGPMIVQLLTGISCIFIDG